MRIPPSPPSVSVVAALAVIMVTTLSTSCNAFTMVTPTVPTSITKQTPTIDSALSLHNNINNDVNPNMNMEGTSISTPMSNRRQVLQKIAALTVAGTVGSVDGTALPANAAAIAKGASDGNMPDLPPEATRSYLQYRVPLQIAADYYMFELQGKVGNIDDWGEINQLFQTNNNRGQGQPNKIERDYTNPMRILGLSMPPDEADRMRDAQFNFERAMARVSKAVSGVRRDMPVEIDKSLVITAKDGWEDGRKALNEFFTILNEVTGLGEMTTIPAPGPDQNKEYGRSARRYFELTKKTKLCQNRGGPALSQAWGQLMISGYLQDNMDSCGIPDLVEYFYQ